MQPPFKAPKYIKQTLTNQNSEVDSNTIIVADVNTPFSIMDSSSTQKTNKERAKLNNTTDQIALKDIYRTFHPTAT